MIFLIFEINFVNLSRFACPVDSITKRVDPTVDLEEADNFTFHQLR